MGWTDERVTTLKKLWLEGHSASQIAKQLGGVTRNAVIGKVHRLGLSGRATPSKPARTIVRMPRPKPIVVAVERRPEAPTPLLRQVARVEQPGSATVLTLSANQCKWPIGDPATREFTFCGQAAGHGPYCDHHAAVAYQPPQRKTKRGEVQELARSLRRYM